VARYAFPVRLFHSRLHAGLSRRYPWLCSPCASQPVRRDELPGSFGPMKCLGPQDDSALGGAFIFGGAEPSAIANLKSPISNLLFQIANLKLPIENDRPVSLKPERATDGTR
jgi:hypothetical protein